MDRHDPGNIDQRIIGRGFGFAMGVDHRGAIRMVQGVQEIEEAIRIILATSPGERRMRPRFGCDLDQVVFAPMDVNTITDIRFKVTEALKRFEPRITVEEVSAVPDPVQDGCLIITIEYTVRATMSRRALVYPFYTIPLNDERIR